MDNKVTLQRLGILLAYPLAYAYIRLIFTFSNEFVIKGTIGQGGFRFNYAYPIFALLFIIINEIVRRGRRGALEKLNAQTIFWYAVTFLAGLTATIGEGQSFEGLEEVSVFGMHLSAVYSVLVSNNILLGGKTSGFIIADLIHGFYVKAFAGFPNFVVDWKCFGKPKAEGEQVVEAGQKKNIFSVIVFVIIMVVLMIISVSLMSSIDEDLGYFFSNFSEIMSDYFGHLKLDEIFARCIFAIPVCFYLYGLMSRSAKSDGEREKRVASWLLKVRGKGKTVSATLVYIAASIFIVAYVLFFIKRLTYMMGGFAGDIPDGMLVSRYAQEGFWQMVGIAAVNLCVYLAIILLGRSDSDGKFALPAKILVTILMIETIAFAVIAMSKIGLYYSIYGYTPKRILAMWATISLTFAAVMTILTVHRGKPHFRAGVIFTSASYIAICILSAVLVAIGA